jgi:microcystin-dependent protein
MKRTSRFVLGALCAGLLLLPAVPAWAQSNAKPPTQMTYQGFLTDGNGSPFGSTAPVNKTVIFRIYDSLTGGNLKWSSQQVVTVDKGYFSVLLGQGSAVGSEPFNADLTGVFTGAGASDRYLELNADGTTIAPRLRFLPAPSALLAKSATELLDPTTGATALSVAGGNVTAGGTLTAANVTATGNLTTSGNLSLTGNLNAGGAVAAASVSGFGTIPLGGIIMWSGAVSSVPTGWALCDGRSSNGRTTPDLRGRFVVGAGQGVGLSNRNVGDTGGAETVTLTVSQIPAHNHRVAGNTTTGGEHTHNFRGYHANFGHSGSATEGSTKNDDDGTFIDSGAITSAGSHSHAFDVTSDSTGGNGSHENMPPFYVLAFIMRVQ